MAREILFNALITICTSAFVSLLTIAFIFAPMIERKSGEKHAKHKQVQQQKNNR